MRRPNVAAALVVAAIAGLAHLPASQPECLPSVTYIGDGRGPYMAGVHWPLFPEEYHPLPCSALGPELKRWP